MHREESKLKRAKGVTADSAHLLRFPFLVGPSGDMTAALALAVGSQGHVVALDPAVGTYGESPESFLAGLRLPGRAHLLPCFPRVSLHPRRLPDPPLQVKPFRPSDHLPSRDEHGRLSIFPFRARASLRVSVELARSPSHPHVQPKLS